MIKGVPIYKKSLLLILAYAMSIVASPASAAEIAIVDVAKVIDASIPGKAGQAYVDALKSRLDQELKRYEAELNDTKAKEKKLAQKREELNERYNEEFTHVTSILMRELNKAAQGWLKDNKHGFVIVLSSNHVVAASPETDISTEILKLLNKATISFTKEK